MSAFMAELGLTPTGGANGSITRLKNQTRRLFSATVTASYEDDKQIADMQHSGHCVGTVCIGGIVSLGHRSSCFTGALGALQPMPHGGPDKAQHHRCRLRNLASGRPHRGDTELLLQCVGAATDDDAGF